MAEGEAARGRQEEGLSFHDVFFCCAKCKLSKLFIRLEDFECFQGGIFRLRFIGFSIAIQEPKLLFSYL